jgi:APA family basic amino acid/polyamine antiporter
MLTAPRVYFAMAEDGLFFKSVAWLNPRTRVPVVAIALQGVFAVVIALSGKYEQILNYVISVDFIWFGLTAASLFVFRHRASGEVGRRQKAEGSKDKQPTAHSLLQTVSSASTGGYFRVPGHPLTTALFVIACALIVFSTIYTHLEDSWIGLLILVSGIPVYFFWRWWRRK